MRNEILISLLKDVDRQLWTRGAYVGIPLEGAALACSLRGLGKSVVLLPTKQETMSLCSDLQILGVEHAFLLDEPPLDEHKLTKDDYLLRRGHIISEWINSEDGVLMTTPGGIVTPYSFGRSGIVLEVGKTSGRNALTAWLNENGYRKTDLVWQPGEFASRGGIVDFFDPSEKAPVRVEFFDEDVESLRFFQPRSQRSFQPLNDFTLHSVNQAEDGARELSWGDFKTVMVKPQKLESSFVAFCELYNALVPTEKRIEDNAYEAFVLNTARLPRLRLREIGEGINQLNLAYSIVPFFKTDLRAAQAYITERLKAGSSVHVTSRNLTGRSLPDGVEFHKNTSLSGGTVASAANEVWISDAELFGVNETFANEIDRGMPLDLEASLKNGQWVIHEKYGLCQLAGTSVENFGGQDYETIVLLFADHEKLIIPTSELFRLTPWNGDGVPEADSLGSKKWRSAWKKAEAQIEAEAQGLLTLYAQRELSQGRALGGDGELLNHFEETFPFQETRDQLRAIRDVKNDMERPWPMERLIVGDVGYGKTEVVLRAAVKAAENGTQTAIVAPTTVLAMQHYRTCAARIGDLPVRVALLSRMVTKKQQKEILDGVANGEIDVLIGTHRLFNTDIVFKDLGLLVIDEEHRFGVKHKEFLKELHPGLDVLSLSATPIPRSLSMALRGIRDISVIATPPRSRGQVFTVTSPWDQGLAYDAILRELTRGGQVYYLHNRVEDILQVAGRIANRFPEHKVAVAHGQMGERELETVMNGFYDGKIDILVCTTIIESGLDVPRANTLIVDDVRHLGLAQMHQIRGRIGRRSEDAYALFFYSPDSGGQTRERLEALGAVSGQSGGYQLAQRDLEIRGAGEILGTEQHGFKERIGYALYLKKLKERVDQLRDAQSVAVETSISLPLVIPLDYVPQTELRIGLYRRLLSPLSFKDYERMNAELLDRYGPLPEQVQGLLDAALIRGEGRVAGIERFNLTASRLTMHGNQLEDLFTPPRWIRQSGDLLGIGGLRGLGAVAAELKRWHFEKENRANKTDQTLEES